jgi:hypothetical protein
VINVINKVQEELIMDRKEIVKLLGEHFSVKPKYMGAPSFAYQIETEEVTFIVDREGKSKTQKV